MSPSSNWGSSLTDTSATMTYVSTDMTRISSSDGTSQSKPKKAKTKSGMQSKLAKAIVNSKLFKGNLTISLVDSKDFQHEDFSGLSRHNTAMFIYIEGVNTQPNINSQNGIILLYTLDECKDIMSRAVRIKNMLVNLKTAPDLPKLLVISKTMPDEEIEEAMYFAGAVDVWKPSQLEELPKKLNFMLCSTKQV